MVSVVKGQYGVSFEHLFSNRPTPSPPLTVQGFPTPPWVQILEAVQQTQQAQQQMQQQMQQLQQEMLAQMQAQTLAAQQAQHANAAANARIRSLITLTLRSPLPNASAPHLHVSQTNPLFPPPPLLLLPLQSQLAEMQEFCELRTQTTSSLPGTTLWLHRNTVR